MAEKGLRLTVDSGSARKGAKEITQAMGKVVASGKKAIDTFEKLKAVMTKSGASFEKLKNTTRVVNTGLDTTTKTTNKLTVAQKAYRNVLERTQKSEALMNSVRDGSIEKMYKTEKAYKDEVAAIKKSINAKSDEQKVDEALIKARLKLENTLIAERARTQALTEAMGVNSVRIQEQRRLTEELTRAKARLATANSQEYADLVRTRQALEMRNKELREGSKKAKVSVDGLASSFTSLGIVLGGVGAYFSVLSLSRVADEYTNITNKLKAVSQGMVDVKSATRGLLESSIENRSSLEGTMEIYSKMIRINESLGKSQQEVALLTETVSKSVALSGASVQGAQGAIMQFAQAMAGDFKSSGQELNSILEQAPDLAIRMAKGLREVTGDTTILAGNLKKLAASGKLSAELVFEALIKALPQLRKDFEATDQTMRSATTGLIDSFTVLIGEIDKANSVSSTLSKGIVYVAKNMDQWKDTILAVSSAIAVGLAGVAIGGLFAVLALLSKTILITTGALTVLTGVFTAAYLNATKYSREAEALVQTNKDLAKSTEDYRDELSQMGSVQIVDQIKSLKDQIVLLDAQMSTAAAKRDAELTKSAAKIRSLSQPNYNGSVESVMQPSGIDPYAGVIQAQQEKMYLDYKMQESQEAAQKANQDLAKATSKDYKDLQKIVEQTQQSIDIIKGKLSTAENALQTAYLNDAEKSINSLSASYKDLKQSLNPVTKAEKDYQSVLEGINKDHADALKMASNLTSEDEKRLTVDKANTAAMRARAAALDVLVSKSVSMTDIQKELTAASNPMAAIDLAYEEQFKNLERVYEAQLRIRQTQAETNQEFQIVDGVKTYSDAVMADLDAIDKQYLKLQVTLSKNKKNDIFASWSDSLLDAANSMKDFADATDSSGKAAAKMQVIVAALTAAQAVQAVVHQATSGDPYTAAARMATIAGMLSSIGALGVSLGGLGGSLSTTYESKQAVQGTGTVLGDATAQSESIGNAVEITANASEKLVGINTDMLKALKSLSVNISGASTLIARDASNTSFSGADKLTGLFNNSKAMTTAGAAIGALVGGTTGFLLGPIGALVGSIVGGAIGGAVSDLIGGSSKVTDEGIRILGGSISDLINNTTVQAYQEVKTKKYVWSSTKTKTKYQGVSQSVEDQFSLVFESIADSVTAAAKLLGMSSQEIEDALNGFVISTINISLKGLSSTAQEEALNAVFSKIFDNMALQVAPFLTMFQEAGEGISETLVRVATNFQVVQEVISQLGLTDLNGTSLGNLTSSEYLVQAAGGYEALAENLTAFVASFETEERKLEIMQNSLTKALAEQNLTLPDTREEFLALAKAQDINTEAGADNLALILGLQDAADSYYSSLEDVNGELDTTFQSILDWVAALNGTSISGYESLAYAQANYQQQLQLAQSGDQTALESITSYAQNVLDAANREVGAYADYAAIAAMIASQVTSLTVPAFADGGYHSGGIRLVGEEGRELEFTGSAKYMSNSETESLLSGSNSSSDDAAVEIVNKMMPYLFQLVKNTGKSAKYIERWDADGIPETRDLTGVV